MTKCTIPFIICKYYILMLFISQQDTIIYNLIFLEWHVNKWWFPRHVRKWVGDENTEIAKGKKGMISLKYIHIYFFLMCIYEKDNFWPDYLQWRE